MVRVDQRVALDGIVCMVLAITLAIALAVILGMRPERGALFKQTLHAER